MNITGNKSIYLLLSVLLPLTACASTEEKAEVKPAAVYYSDCSVVNLQSADGANMTRDELIAAQENNLYDALDANRECNEQALKAGQQAVAAASPPGGQGETGQHGGTQPQTQGSDANGTVTNGTAQTESPISEILEQISQSNTGNGGGATGVNGEEVTVCQISRDNLAAATTPEDKAFWQTEVDKNCR